MNYLGASRGVLAEAKEFDLHSICVWPILTPVDT